MQWPTLCRTPGYGHSPDVSLRYWLVAAAARTHQKHITLLDEWILLTYGYTPPPQTSLLRWTTTAAVLTIESWVLEDQLHELLDLTDSVSLLVSRCVVYRSRPTTETLTYLLRCQGISQFCLSSTRLPTNGMNGPCLCHPSQSCPLVPTPGGWKAELA